MQKLFMFLMFIVIAQSLKTFEQLFIVTCKILEISHCYLESHRKQCSALRVNPACVIR